jgi:hypothetical protein
MRELWPRQSTTSAPELPDDPELLRLLPLVGSLPAARAVHTGVETSAALWWSLFEDSARALSTESVTSLKHAGATAVDENGVIEPDLTDDVDFVGGTAKKEQEQR